MPQGFLDVSLLALGLAGGVRDIRVVLAAGTRLGAALQLAIVVLAVDAFHSGHALVAMQIADPATALTAST